MLGVVDTLRIVYTIDVADQGTRKLLDSERRAQGSIKKTSAVLAQRDAATKRSTTVTTKAAAASAAAHQREGRAAQHSAAGVTKLRAAQASAAAGAPKWSRSAVMTAAAYDKQTAAATRLTSAERARTSATERAARVSRRSGAAASAGVSRRSGAAASAGGARRPGVVASAGRTASSARSNVGLAAGFAGAVGIKQAIDFDRALRNVNSIAGLTEKQLQAVGQQLRGMAGDSAQAPVTLAKGMYDLVSSGFDAEQSLKIVRVAAEAATAGLTTTEVSTAAVAGALNAYKLPATQASKVADVLFKTVDRGVISFEALAENIGPVQGMASSLKIPLDQVGASIATLTKQGIPVPETMTYIRASMSALLKPSKDMQGAFKELGVNGVEGLLQKFGGFQGAMEAVAGTTDGTKAALSGLFPNVRALGAAMGLTGDKAKGARKDVKDLGDSSGATQKALAEQSKSTAYQWEQAKANAQALAITVGNNLLPPMNKTLKTFTALPGPVKIALAAIGGTALVIGPINKLRKNMIELGGSIKTAGRAAAKSRIASSLAAGASGAGQKMRRALAGVRGAITSLMSRAGRSGGSAAANSIASSAGGAVNAQMTARSGKFRAAGRASGRVLGRAMGVAAAAAIAVAVGNAIVALTDKIGLLGGAAGRKSRGNWIDKNIPGMSALRALGQRAGLEPKRRGGIVRRYQHGGLVPIVASGGEMLVDGGRASMIGGPSDRDATPMLAPAGSAILTGSGQAMMAAGASLREAVAMQAPHFAKGGVVGDFNRAISTTKAGPKPSLALFMAGIVESRLRNLTYGDRDSLGALQLRAGIHGKALAMDPYASARAFLTRGFWGKGGALNLAARNPRATAGWVAQQVQGSAFPGRYDQVRGRAQGYLRGAAGAARAASGGGGESAGSSMYGRSRRRAGLLGDASFEQGRSAGQAGMTNSAIRRDGSPVLSAVREALSSASSQTGGSAVATRARSGGSGAGSATGSAIKPGGGWGGSESIIRTAIRGLGPATFKRAANSALSLKNPGSDHSTANRGAFAADLPPGDGVFNTLRKRLNIPARKGAWNKFANRPVKGYRSQLLWHAPDGSHRDHVHVGARKMRRGGVVGAGRALNAGLGRVNTFAGGSLDALDDIIRRAAEQRLVALRRQVQARVNRGGSKRVVDRLRGVLDLIDGELGRRVGRLEDVVAQRTARIDRGRGFAERVLRARGVNADSPAGIGAMGAVQAAETGVRAQNVSSLQKALQTAARARNRNAVREITQQLHDAQDALQESLVRQIELARDAIRAAGTERVNAAQFGASWMQGNMASLDASQRLNRTQDSAQGMRQRASWISQGVVPALAQQVAAARFNAQLLGSIGDLDGWRQAVLDAQSATTDLANAQADAADLMREAAAKVVQDRVDATAHGTTMADLRMARLEVEQRLAGTYESGGGAQARADLIRRQIVPALDAEILAFTAQQMEAQRQGNTDLVRQLQEAIFAKQTDILQKNLDANEQTAANTDLLKEFGGSSAFSYRDQMFTDLDVIAARTGA